MERLRRRNAGTRAHRRLQFGHSNPSASASYADAPPNSYACAYPDAHAIAQSDAYPNAHSYAYSDIYAQPNAYRNSYAYDHSHAYPYANPYAHTDAYPHRNAIPHSRAAVPVDGVRSGNVARRRADLAGHLRGRQHSRPVRMGAHQSP